MQMPTKVTWALPPTERTPDTAKIFTHRQILAVGAGHFESYTCGMRSISTYKRDVKKLGGVPHRFNHSNKTVFSLFHEHW
jgi:hypothetical protein